MHANYAGRDSFSTCVICGSNKKIMSNRGQASEIKLFFGYHTNALFGITLLIICGGGWGELRGAGNLLGFGFSQVYLSEEVQPGTIFALGTLYADPEHQRPKSSYAAVSGMHQRDCNYTLDVTARLRVWLPQLGDQVTG